MDNDFSIESMYMNMGLSQDNIFTSKEKGIENYDENSGAYEITKNKILINSTELYLDLVELNNIQKMKLAERINKNYGIYSRSLENYCEKLIYSTENKENIQNIFKSFFHLIGDFFKTIFNAIQRTFNRIIEWVTDKLTEKSDKEREARIKKYHDDEVKKYKQKRDDELKKNIDMAKTFKDVMHSLEPLNSEFSKNLENISKIEINDKDDKSIKCLKIFQKQCKFVSIYYQILLNASNKIIDYIKQYYDEVEKNVEDITIRYCEPNIVKIQRIGNEFKQLLSNLNNEAKTILTTMRIDGNKKILQYQKECGLIKNILTTDDYIESFLCIMSCDHKYVSTILGSAKIKFTHREEYELGCSFDDYEKTAIDDILNSTDNYLTAIEEIKNNGIDKFLKDIFGIMAHYDKDDVKFRY